MVGTVLGLSGAALLTRFLEALLFGVRLLDPASFTAVTCLLLAIAFVACWLPMRRAMEVDPAVGLRVE